MLWWLFAFGYTAVGLGVGRVVYVAMDAEFETREDRGIGATVSVFLWPLVVVFFTMAAVGKLTVARPTPREVKLRKEQEQRELERLQDKAETSVRLWNDPRNSDVNGYG